MHRCTLTYSTWRHYDLLLFLSSLKRNLGPLTFAYHNFCVLSLTLLSILSSNHCLCTVFRSSPLCFFLAVYQLLALFFSKFDPLSVRLCLLCICLAFYPTLHSYNLPSVRPPVVLFDHWLLYLSFLLLFHLFACLSVCPIYLLVFRYSLVLLFRPFVLFFCSFVSTSARLLFSIVDSFIVRLCLLCFRLAVYPILYPYD